MRWLRNPLSFEILRTTRVLVKGSHNIRATIYAILALMLSWVYALGPLGVGLYFLTQAEMLKALVVPILIYLYVWLFLAFWPVWFLLGWYHEGFVASLLGTGITAVILLAPDWLMARAMRAAEKAAEIDAESMTLDSGHAAGEPDAASSPAPDSPGMEESILKCPNPHCATNLRVPSGGHLKITCPRCNTTFVQHT